MAECLKTEAIVHPQCQFFVVHKKRLCRMTVRPGRNYCGEHEPLPRNELGQNDTRIPCPYDSKHTCYASKLEKHLSICNARQTELPAYIVHNINSPASDAGGSEPEARLSLSQVPPEELLRVIDKVNHIYEKYIEGHIVTLAERPIHPAVAAEFAEEGRAEGSRRHLRQASALLHLVERHGLVRPGTCYVELGAGKGRLAYYAGSSWCDGTAGERSRVLAVDRAALRHKRDNKLRAPASAGAGAAPAARLRADLAHLALERVPAVEASARVVGFAKHLCGAATDLALRCVTSAGALGKTRGVVLATCCHHRCERAHLAGAERLRELGVGVAELRVLLGVVSWATCGGSDEARARVGRRAKALLDWARAHWLGSLGFSAYLCRFVPRAVSPENVCIVATR